MGLNRLTDSLLAATIRGWLADGHTADEIWNEVAVQVGATYKPGHAIVYDSGATVVSHCRNVSVIFVPKDADAEAIATALRGGDDG